MKANELRIGNLVECESYLSEIVGIVDECLNTGIKTKLQAMVKSPPKMWHLHGSQLDIILSPIPITPEWLERIGFEKMTRVKWHGNGADYQPKDVFTTHDDFVYDIPNSDRKFVFRYIEWHWSGGIDKSIEVLFPISYYAKINENDVPLDYGPKFVHQLQNIYFAIIGQELEIKMP